MATKLEPLNLRITGNASGLSAALGKAQGNVRSFAIRVDNQARQIGDRLKNIATFAVPAGLVSGLGFGVKMAAEVQQIEAAFKSLTGSADEADKMIKRLRDLASSTPLQFQGLAKAAQTLLAYGSANDEVAGQIRLLGDVSLGNQEKLDRLAVAFGQVQAKGRLMAQEVNQMVENGFNPLAEISRTTNRSMEDLFKAMENGEISFDIVVEAFKSATSEGGRFFQAMENQSQTLTGRLSTLKDNVGILAAQVGEVLLPAVSAIVEESIEWVEYLKQIDTTTAESIAKTIAFTAALSGTAIVLPRLIALAKQVAIGIRSIATASTIAQALSGPKGWASIAAGLAVAGASVYAVDQLFASFNQTQKKTVEQAQQVDDSLRNVAEGFSQTGDAAKDATKEHEQWLKIAADFRKSLETPIEAYQRKIEDLSLAVRNGGLEWEFMERGIKKALQELDNATKKSASLKRPDAVLKGSAEDLDTLFAFQQQGDDKSNLDSRVADELADIQGRIAEEQKKAAEQAAELKKNTTEAAVAAAEANVDRLVAGIDEAKQKFRELAEQSKGLGDVSYDTDTLTDRINSAGSGLRALFTGDLGHVAVDPEKESRLNAFSEKSDKLFTDVITKEEQLTRAQAELEAKRQAAADARRERQLLEQTVATNNLAEAIRNRSEPQPLEL
jgi:tape measure domain-containing protein